MSRAYGSNCLHSIVAALGVLSQIMGGGNREGIVFLVSLTVCSAYRYATE